VGYAGGGQAVLEDVRRHSRLPALFASSHAAPSCLREGSPQAELVLWARPRADEDAREDRSWTRRQLLTKIIGRWDCEGRGLHMQHPEVSSSGNRNPQPDEIAECEPF